MRKMIRESSYPNPSEIPLPPKRPSNDSGYAGDEKTTKIRLRKIIELKDIEIARLNNTLNKKIFYYLHCKNKKIFY